MAEDFQPLDPPRRIADALERIADSLERLADCVVDSPNPERKPMFRIVRCVIRAHMRRK